MKILLVDDDLDLLEITAFALQQAGFVVVKATSGRSALETFDLERPDLAVVDINMPGMDGFELARRLRQQAAIPVIMLTVRSEEEDVVRALALGADDYLTKPFSPRILIARIRALLRRVGLEAEGTVRAGDLTLDTEDLKLTGLTREPIRLTPLETRLLQLLLVNGGKTVAADRILTHVWGSRAGGNRQLLKQLVHRLRQKIERDARNPALLRTVPNCGYVFDADAVATAAARGSQTIDDGEDEREAQPHD